MRLKLNNDAMKAVFIYVKFVMGYLLSEKGRIKASIRTAEINTEITSLKEVERKIVMKQYAPNPKNKSRSVALKTHEAFTMVKYQKVYDSGPHCDKFIEHTLNTNFGELWMDLLK